VNRETERTVSVIKVLESQYGYERATGLPDLLKDRSFVVLWQRKDPISLVLVADVTGLPDRQVVVVCKEFESFIWDLFSHNKRNSVSAVLIGFTDAKSDEQSRALKRLGRLARIIMLPTGVGGELLENQLKIFGPPDLVKAPAGAELARLGAEISDVSKDLDKSVVARLVELAMTAKNSDELKQSVSQHYESLLSGVQNALTQSKR